MDRLLIVWVLAGITLYLGCKTTTKEPQKMQLSEITRGSIQTENYSKKKLKSKEQQIEEELDNIRDSIETFKKTAHMDTQVLNLQPQITDRILEIDDDVLLSVITDPDFDTHIESLYERDTSQDQESSPQNGNRNSDELRMDAGKTEEEEKKAREEKDKILGLYSGGWFITICSFSAIFGATTIRDYANLGFNKRAGLQALTVLGMVLAGIAAYDQSSDSDQIILFGVSAVLEGALAVHVYQEVLRKSPKLTAREKVYYLMDYIKNLPSDITAGAKNTMAMVKNFFKKSPTPSITPSLDTSKKPQVPTGLDGDLVTGKVKTSTDADPEVASKKKNALIWWSGVFWLAIGLRELIVGAYAVKDYYDMKEIDKLKLADSAVSPAKIMMSQISESVLKIRKIHAESF